MPPDHPGIAQGVALFDAGRYWHAHEAWEAAWRADRSPRRDLLRGLIQTAAIWHHLHADRPRAARRVVDTARMRLEGYRAVRQPVAVQPILRILDDLAAALDRGEHPPPPDMRLG